MAKDSKDSVVRAMTQDGQFRVMAATIADTVAEACEHQNAPPELALRQAHLICAGVLIRETMQPGNRVQIVLKDEEGHRLVADSLPDGKSRSIVNPGESGAPELARAGLFQVNYTLRNGELHQGIVALDERADVSAAMMRYLKDSEQITAYVWIDTVERPGGELSVGGFVMQVTPEVTPEGLAAMTAHLQAFTGLPAWLAQKQPDPKDLIASILEAHEYAILADSPLSFGCTCSMDRMILGLSTLGSTELADMLKDGEPVEVSCDACGRYYNISTEQIAALIRDLESPETDSDSLPN